VSASAGGAAGVIVGVTLLGSGVLKQASRQWPAQAVSLGVGAFVARLVPIVEIVLGSMMVVGVARSVAAWAAVALLVAFTSFLVRRLRQGVHVPCACFGALSARPVGPWSVARNVALIAAAVVAAVA
jgi:uncharacterized membrane protein YphA (DoxX/SURF4 family)